MERKTRIGRDVPTKQPIRAAVYETADEADWPQLEQKPANSTKPYPDSNTMITSRREFISEKRRKREKLRENTRAWARERPDAMDPDLPRWFVYEMRYVMLGTGQPTSQTRAQADRLFNDLKLTGYKMSEKQAEFGLLLHAGKQAVLSRGCVACRRQDTRGVHSQVIDAACEAGFFISHRSPPGAKKMSRLLPTSRIAELTEPDPWASDPDQQEQLVFLRDRETKQDIPFNPADKTPAYIQRGLELVNRVNSRFRITYQPYDPWRDELSFHPETQLRPVHFAVFTDRWDSAGRIYTGKYGHQSLRQIERQTIEFNGEPSVEMDFSALHIRLICDLGDVEFEGDPYSLWPETTPPMRMLAKMVINAALNATSRTAAISACNQAMSSRTTAGEWKTGKARSKANTLLAAVRETGLSFASIYDTALERHEPLAEFFGSDAGMMLMNIDGRIAFNVLRHFAKHNTPCLGVHDSFVCPAKHGMNLLKTMKHFYRKETGHDPVIKVVGDRSGTLL